MSIKVFRPQYKDNICCNKIFYLLFFLLVIVFVSFGHGICYACFMAILGFICYIFFQKNIDLWRVDGYETIKIDTEKRVISFDNSCCIKSNEIETIEIVENPLPEALMGKHYIKPINDDLRFYLKDNSVISIKVQNKLKLIQIIDILETWNFNINNPNLIEDYRTDVNNGNVLIMIMVVIIVFILNYLF